MRLWFENHADSDSVWITAELAANDDMFDSVTLVSMGTDSARRLRNELDKAIERAERARDAA